MANNPALYAYFLKKYLKNPEKDRIRILSLGTGSKPINENY